MKQKIIVGIVAFALAFICGCSQDNEQATLDGDVDTQEEMESMDEESSVEPELPRLPDCLSGNEPAGCAEAPRLKDWTCRQGWSQIPAFTDEGGHEHVPEGLEQIHICRPQPRTQCASSHMQLPGDEDCRRIGTKCPVSEDGFLDQADIRSLAEEFDGPIVYVKADATGYGNGRRNSPYNSVNDALQAGQEDGSIIALSAGTFEEELILNSQLALVGACVDETILRSAGSMESGTITLTRSAEVLITNLTVTGDNPGIILRKVTATPIFRNMVVDGALLGGITLMGNYGVEISNVAVRNVKPVIGTGGGYGLLAFESSNATISHSVFEDNVGGGFLVAGDDGKSTTIDATNVFIGYTEQYEAEAGGRGIEIQVESFVTLTGVHILHAYETGIISGGNAPQRGPDLTIADVTIEGTRMVSNNRGIGMECSLGGSLTASQLLVEGNHDVGLFFDANGMEGQTDVKITDLIVRDTKSLPGHRSGAGLGIQKGAAVVMERAMFSRNRLAGIYLSQSESTVISSLEGEDLVILDTETSQGDAGNGLECQLGTRTKIQRMLLERNTGIGMFIWGRLPDSPAVAEMQDITVRDTQQAPEGLFGRGINIQYAVNSSFERIVLERNFNTGIFSAGDTIKGTPDISFKQVLVRDTEAPENYYQGRGIDIGLGGKYSFSQLVVESSRVLGILMGSEAGHERGILEFTDILVRDTQNASWGVINNGNGFEAWGNVSVMIKRGLFERNSCQAMMFGLGAKSEIESLTIEQTRICDCGQIPEGEEGSCIENGKNLGNGSGLSIIDSADVDISRFSISESDFVGVFIAKNGMVELHDGAIYENEIGVNVLVEDYNLDKIQDNVMVYNNGTDFAQKEMPIPEINDLLEIEETHQQYHGISGNKHQSDCINKHTGKRTDLRSLNAAFFP